MNISVFCGRGGSPESGLPGTLWVPTCQEEQRERERGYALEPWFSLASEAAIISETLLRTEAGAGL